MKPKLYIPCVLCGISFRWVVIVGSIPAVLAVFVLIVFVKEHRGAAATAATTGLPKNIPGFDKKFWMFLGILGVFTLGNSSDFFVILRAQNLNVSLLMVVLMLVMFNMTSAAISLPSGHSL